MSAKQKRHWAIEKAISVLTDNNAIDIMLMDELCKKLDPMNDGDLAMLIASEYSPEGATKWQDLIEGN